MNERQVLDEDTVSRYASMRPPELERRLPDVQRQLDRDFGPGEGARWQHLCALEALIEKLLRGYARGRKVLPEACFLGCATRVDARTGAALGELRGVWAAPCTDHDERTFFRWGLLGKLPPGHRYRMIPWMGANSGDSWLLVSQQGPFDPTPEPRAGARRRARPAGASMPGSDARDASERRPRTLHRKSGVSETFA